MRVALRFLFFPFAVFFFRAWGFAAERGTSRAIVLIALPLRRVWPQENRLGIMIGGHGIYPENIYRENPGFYDTYLCQ